MLNKCTAAAHGSISERQKNMHQENLYRICCRDFSTSAHFLKVNHTDLYRIRPDLWHLFVHATRKSVGKFPFY